MAPYIPLVIHTGRVDDSRKSLRFVNTFSDIVRIAVVRPWFFPERVFHVKTGVSLFLIYIVICLSISNRSRGGQRRGAATDVSLHYGLLLKRMIRVQEIYDVHTSYLFAKRVGLSGRRCLWREKCGERANRGRSRRGEKQKPPVRRFAFSLLLPLLV